MEQHSIRVIARIYSDFKTKFGVPRQSGLVPELTARIVFEPAFRDPDALRGIEGFDRLWLIWRFSASTSDKWRPTVRPPRLGGNARMGVFATRSPFRPNPLGLSCVRLERVDWDAGDGPALVVLGADLIDGTPIYDIKPYIPYADAFPDALGGFASSRPETVAVSFPPELLSRVEEGKRAALLGVLANDPRPRYQDDPERVYGMAFGAYEVRFRVMEGVLTVVGLEKTQKTGAYD